MVEIVAKILTVSGLLIDFVAVVIGGRAWIYRAVAGVRAAFAWNGRRLVSQNAKHQLKRERLQTSFAAQPSFLKMYWLQSHLSGMRLHAWLVDTQNAKQRASLDLPPRSLVTLSCFIDDRQLAINTQEIDAALQDRSATGTPRDFSSAAFKLFCFGSVLSLVGAIL